MNNTRAHKIAVQEIRKRIGREDDFTLWENSKVTVVNGTPRAAPGLCVGASDLLGILAPSGRLVALEVKTGKGDTTDKQEMFLALIRKRGGFACVVHSADEAHDALQRARAGQSE